MRSDATEAQCPNARRSAWGCLSGEFCLLTPPMNDAPPDPTSTSAIYAQPWAVRIGFTVLVALTLILGLAFFDQAHRRELETVSETTAVGDTRYLPEEQVAALQLKPFEVRDSHVTRAGQDEGRSLTIYVLSKAATAAEHKHVGRESAPLLKTGVNQYVVAPTAAK